MKLTKKTIVSNTILFIGIIGFILLFGKFFGDENILIGVSTITAMLMLLERDLTSHLLGNTLKFVLLNLFIGIAAFFAGFNPFLAIPINFIAMFVISYSLLFNLKNPLYLPFSLQYLFILATPVAIDHMPMRLASLVFGALAIMGIQMLANKNKITKSGDKKILAICAGLVEKVQTICKGEDNDDLNNQIRTDLSALRSIIYDKREENYYLTEEGRLKLNISASFEKLNILLDSFAAENPQTVPIERVMHFLQTASDCFTDQKPTAILDESMDELIAVYENNYTNYPLAMRLLNTCDFLKDSIVELKSLNKKEYNIIKNLENIPKKFQRLRISETKSHTNSIKVSYTVRMAVAISLTGFLTDYFALTEGRWMMFTVLSVIIPIYEQSQKKMRDRIFATIVGAVLVTGTFMIFQSSMIRSILLMTAGYLMSYVKVYRYSTILVTFSAIGAAALITGATEILTLERVLLVGLGVILALLINRFILPYKLEDANRDLKEMYSDTLHEMLVETSSQLKSTGHEHAMKNLLLMTTMIEDRLKLNNQSLPSEKGINWLEIQRRIASTIYELHEWIRKHGIQKAALLPLSSGLDVLMNRSSTEDALGNTIEMLKEHIKSTPTIEDRMALGMLLEITEEVQSKNLL